MSHMSLLCVRPDVSLETRHHPLVHVVRHDAHQLHAPLNLWRRQEAQVRTVSGRLLHACVIDTQPGATIHELQVT